MLLDTPWLVLTPCLLGFNDASFCSRLCRMPCDMNTLIQNGIGPALTTVTYSLHVSTYIYLQSKYYYNTVWISCMDCSLAQYNIIVIKLYRNIFHQCMVNGIIYLYICSSYCTCSIPSTKKAMCMLLGTQPPFLAHHRSLPERRRTEWSLRHIMVRSKMKKMGISYQ